MANPDKILVTGATGNVGSVLIPNLTNLGADVRALVRDESKAQGLEDAGVEVVTGDLEKPETLDAAFRGVDKVFLITPPNPLQVIQAKNGIEAARRAGSPFVVRLSAGAVKMSGALPRISGEGVLKEMPGALPTISGQHVQTDGMLEASGLPYNIIRPHFFMQVTMMAAQTVASEGVVYWAMKDGKVGAIDVRDIVDVALKVLTEDGHEGKTYTLTGPASISFHDIATELSKALGKQVNYVNVPPEAAREGMIGMGLPEWVADAFGEYMTAFGEGYGDFTTPDVEEVTGHPARSYETFARDFAQVFGATVAQAV